MRSAPRFQLVTMPSSDLPMMASSEPSTMAARRACVSSGRSCRVRSIAVPIARSGRPLASRTITTFDASRRTWPSSPRLRYSTSYSPGPASAASNAALSRSWSSGWMRARNSSPRRTVTPAGTPSIAANRSETRTSPVIRSASQTPISKGRLGASPAGTRFKPSGANRRTRDGLSLRPGGRSSGSGSGPAPLRQAVRRPDTDPFMQREALDLSGRGARQRLEKGEPPRPLEARQPIGARALDALPQRVGLAQRAHHAGNELRQAALVRRADHGALADAVDRRHDALHLRRRDPLPGDLQQVVGAAEDPEGAVGVLDRLVAGRQPLAPKSPTRRLRALPVTGSDAFPADEKPSGGSRRDRRATLGDHPHPVAGDGPADRSRPAFAGLVREEDVQRLGGADAVYDCVAEAVLPGVEERFVQGLARRDYEEA